VFKLLHLLKEYGTAICTEEDALLDVASLTKSFTETSLALYTAVRLMANKG
jgi:hypothetical protein